MKITKFLLITTTFCFSLLLFSCATKYEKYKSFEESYYSLKKGMRVDEVLKIMGEPMGSGSSPMPGTSEIVQSYTFVDSNPDSNPYTKMLTAIFREDNLVQAKLNVREGSYSEAKDVIESDLNDFTPKSLHKSYQQTSSKNSMNRSLNLTDAKNELLDKYLRKEITKEEYFQLRRELEKR